MNKFSEKSDKFLRLETLPTDVLYVILSYCDIKCLYSLSCCSKKFNNLIQNDDYIWLKRCFDALATNQRTQQMITRCSRLLSPLEKCKISCNWKKGFYSEKYLIRHKSRSFRIEAIFLLKIKSISGLDIFRGFVWINISFGLQKET